MNSVEVTETYNYKTKMLETANAVKQIFIDLQTEDMNSHDYVTFILNVIINVFGNFTLNVIKPEQVNAFKDDFIKGIDLWFDEMKKRNN